MLRLSSNPLLPQPHGFEGFLPLEESTNAHNPPVLEVKYLELPLLDSDATGRYASGTPNRDGDPGPNIGELLACSELPRSLR
jgi:hypothetical protein